MLYASSVASTCVLIGAEKVSKQVAFNTLKQFVWDDFHQGEVKLKNKEDFLAEENDKALPFSDRELAQRQVDREERVARAEMGTKAKEASGFHTVAFPLAPEAEAAIKEMLAGGHTWTQLVRLVLSFPLAHPFLSRSTLLSRRLSCARKSRPPVLLLLPTCSKRPSHSSISISSRIIFRF